MLILGVDTSGRHGSIALVRGDALSCATLQVAEIAGGTYSAQLIPQLARMLQELQFGKHDLEGFAVASGPGSFTGLRVGLSTVKGLAEVLHKPISSISVLEAVAAASTQEGRVIAALDAGRDEVYTGEYEVRKGRLRSAVESLLTRTEFSALLERQADAQLITPHGTVAEGARFHTRVTQIDPPHADVFARLGLSKILAGETIAPEALEANYLRRSDAELFGKAGF